VSGDSLSAFTATPSWAAGFLHKTGKLRAL
jgi:hypothetical protein